MVFSGSQLPGLSARKVWRVTQIKCWVRNKEWAEELMQPKDSLVTVRQSRSQNRADVLRNPRFPLSKFSYGLQKVSVLAHKVFWFLINTTLSIALHRGPNFPLSLKPMHSGNPFQRAGFSVATLKVLAVSWLPTKTITQEWKLSRGAHSGSGHLKGKVSNFLWLKKISFHNFQNILIMSKTWKLFSLGSRSVMFNYFLDFFFKQAISLLIFGNRT